MIRFPALLLPLLLAACATPERSETAEVPARRTDVVAALYKQLELVLVRYEELADDESDAATRERAELLQTAREIRLRIVHFDPHADLDALSRDPTGMDAGPPRRGAE